MQNPAIPMKPEQRPQQRVYEVLTLPQRPGSFHCRVGHGEVPEEAVPKKGPRVAIYLGQVEWAWSPMNNRLDAYYLHRGRRYWILWIRYFGFSEQWHPVACVRHSEASRKQAAVYLLMALWQVEDCDKFHWINEASYLSVAELQAIAREVWSSEDEGA